MNKQQVAIVALMMVSPLTQAFGIVKPGWERPIQRAEMKVDGAQGAFNDVKDVDLTLTRKDVELTAQDIVPRRLPVTGMIVEYTVDRNVGSDRDMLVQEERVKMVLVVDQQPSKDECGSTIYIGRLASEKKEPVGARFSVVLRDHSTRLCEDLKPYRWEAHVRQGFGWCGTGDAVMDLVGNPEAVYTIQSMPGLGIEDDRDSFTKHTTDLQ